jgi:hypothetical protein
MLRSVRYSPVGSRLLNPTRWAAVFDTLGIDSDIEVRDGIIPKQAQTQHGGLSHGLNPSNQFCLESAVAFVQPPVFKLTL